MTGEGMEERGGLGQSRLGVSAHAANTDINDTVAGKLVCSEAERFSRPEKDLCLVSST